MERKISVRILDTSYTLITEESEEYANRVAKILDEELRAILEASKFSHAMASVYAAFKFCDEKIKAQETCDSLRGQLKSYIEDMNKLRVNYDDLKRENTRLTNEVSSMKGRLSKLAKDQ